jgi:uncharacterized membrane protein YdjX (TVP38/TMEM64 family)
LLVAAVLVVGYVGAPHQAGAPPVIRHESPRAPVGTSVAGRYGVFLGGFLVIAALVAAGFLAVRMARRLRRKKMQRQPEEITTAAKAYFEGLGKASQR